VAKNDDKFDIHNDNHLLDTTTANADVITAFPAGIALV